MTGRQRHLLQLADVPGADDQAPALRIPFYLGDDAIDLINHRAVAAAPPNPLRAIDGAEIAALVRPFVPDRHSFFVERTHVCVAAQKPEQLMDNRFQMQLLRCQERKSFPQIEPRLRPEDRERSGPGAIFARRAVVENKPEKIVVLAHAS